MIPYRQVSQLIRRNEWLEFNRSGQHDTQFLMKMMLYVLTGLAGLFMAIGLWHLEEVLLEMNQLGEGTVTLWINKYIFFYFVAEFYLRFFTQKSPQLAVEKYLVWPINKKHLALYAIGKSLVGAPLFFLLIFSLISTFRYVVPEYGFIMGWAWLLSVVAVSFLLHSFFLWLKIAQRDMTIILLSIIIIVASISLIEKYTSISLLVYMGIGFNVILRYPGLALVAIAISLGIGARLLNFMAAQLNNPPVPSEYSYGWMDKSIGLGEKWGLSASFAEIEWKLIIRHKRTRYYLFMSLLFLFYGLFYYHDNQGENAYAISNMIPALLLMTTFTNQYGSYFFNWNSSFFEFYLIQPHGLKALIYGKLYLFMVLTLLTFLLCLPYVYFGLPILFLHLALALFTMGVLMYVFVGVGIATAFKIDLNKSGTVYGEDMGCMKIVVMLPVLFLPFGIYIPFQIYGFPEMGLAIIGGLGLLGFILFPKLAMYITQRALKKRYKLIETFNKKD